MTLYEISVITTTGFPYYRTQIKTPPENVKVLLRFYDFSQTNETLVMEEQIDLNLKFDLTAGLISALYEFAKNIGKKINVLEFKSKSRELKNQVEENVEIEDENYEGDVLITVQTESFLRHKAVYEKVKLIYELILTTKIPLDSAYGILQNEEDLIVEILTDAKARKHIANHQNEIESLGNNFIFEMKDYGLETICITSFDFSPIVTYGGKYTLNDVEIILRNIGFIPEINSLEWIYRQSFLKEEQVWVYMIDSGIGPTVEESLFEPYFYLLIAKPNTYIGEFPLKLTTEFNKILN